METTAIEKKEIKTPKPQDFAPLAMEVAALCEMPVPEIDSEPVYLAVTADSLAARKLYQKVDARRRFFTDPLEIIIKGINKIAAPLMDACKMRELDCDQATKTFRFQQEQARKESERIARLAVAEANRKRLAEIEAQAAKKMKEAAKIKDAELAEQRQLEAEQMRANFRPAPMPVFEAQKIKADGIRISKVCKYRITDETLLPDEFTKRIPDKSALNAIAKNGKGLARQNAGNPIPGVEFYEDETSAKTLNSDDDV